MKKSKWCKTSFDEYILLSLNANILKHKRRHFKSSAKSYDLELTQLKKENKNGKKLITLIFVIY